MHGVTAARPYRLQFASAVAYRAYDGLARLRWHLAIGAIVGIAALLRFVRLGDVPLPITDEVFAAVDLHSLMSTGRHFTGERAGLLAHIIPAIDGRFIAWLLGGGSLPDLRAVAATFGVVTVALMVPLGIELGEFALGVLAAAALAVMPWHIYFSRIYYPASEYLFLTLLALLLALRALRKTSIVAAMGSCIAAILSVYLYPVAIVATPLLLAGVVIHRRDHLTLFGLRRTLTVALLAALLLTPYLIDHFAITDPSLATQNQVIALKMIWNHGLSVAAIAGEFLQQWLSFMSGPFTILTGDPNVRWSIQVMGSVGWVAGTIGWIGVTLALGRRTPRDGLLLFWLAAFPVADALTYYDASPNSVRGITGAFIWALLVATGILAVRNLGTSSLRVAIATAICVGIVVQILGFSWIYFGRYNHDYAYAFETGYPTIYSVLRQNGLESIPITLHAGYERDAMLQYFSQYRLHASDQMLSCFDMPSDMLNPTLPRVFIVREDPDVQSLPRCIHKGLILRDETALLGVSKRDGEAQRHVDVIAVFPDDVSRRYFTAIFYVHY